MSVAQTLESVLEKVRSLVQAEAVVGTPIQTPDGATILPICRISVGFAAGGNSNAPKDAIGTGAGAVITPVAFLVLRPDKTELVPMDRQAWQFGRILDLVPDLLDRIQEGLRRPKKNSAEDT
ncbi:MAG: hypothetical protein H6686_07060 [Fibrobacteria bacterium]|nr:hypothetical protein [Fibrobacteria bacterium]